MVGRRLDHLPLRGDLADRRVPGHADFFLLDAVGEGLEGRPRAASAPCRAIALMAGLPVMASQALPSPSAMEHDDAADERRCTGLHFLILRHDSLPSGLTTADRTPGHTAGRYRLTSSPGQEISVRAVDGVVIESRILGLQRRTRLATDAPARQVGHEGRHPDGQGQGRQAHEQAAEGVPRLRPVPNRRRMPRRRKALSAKYLILSQTAT